MSPSTAATSHGDHEALCQFLATRDYACPSCSYNLRGLTSDRCPECDEALMMRVGAADPNVGRWVATLAGLLATSGTALVISLIVAYICIVRGDLPPAGEFFPIVVYPPIVLALTGAPAIWLATPRGRRWFRKRTSSWRLRLAAGAWMAPLVAVALFIAMVRR